MRYLVDTGVLLRLFDVSDSNHLAIRSLFRRLRRERTLSLCTAAQNIAEFWNVSTRPASSRGGYGQDVRATQRRVQFIEKFGQVLSDYPDAYAEWRQLVVDHQVKGVSVHDTKLVAVMQAASISTIITLNTQDFVRYTTITALTPQQVLVAM